MLSSNKDYHCEEGSSIKMSAAQIALNFSLVFYCFNQQCWATILYITNSMNPFKVGTWLVKVIFVMLSTIFAN